MSVITSSSYRFGKSNKVSHECSSLNNNCFLTSKRTFLSSTLACKAGSQYRLSRITVRRRRWRFRLVIFTFFLYFWGFSWFTFPSTCVQQMPTFLLSFSFVAKKHRVEDKFLQGNLATLPFYEKLFAAPCLSLSGTTQLRWNLLYTFKSTITMHCYSQAHITGDTANQFSSTEIKWANKCWRCVASTEKLLLTLKKSTQN